MIYVYLKSQLICMNSFPYHAKVMFAYVIIVLSYFLNQTKMFNLSEKNHLFERHRSYMEDF